MQTLKHDADAGSSAAIVLALIAVELEVIVQYTEAERWPREANVGKLTPIAEDPEAPVMVQSIPEMIHPRRVLTPEDLEGDLIQPGDPLMGIVWINPDRMSGTPCFSGTRVPVQHLFDHLAAGDTLDEFLIGFPGVSRDQVLAVIRLAGASLLHGFPVSSL